MSELVKLATIVATAFCFIVVIGLIFNLNKIHEKNIQETRIACIDTGGTWLSPGTCVAK